MDKENIKRFFEEFSLRDRSGQKVKQYFSTVKNSIDYYVLQFAFVSSICTPVCAGGRYNPLKMRGFFELCRKLRYLQGFNDQLFRRLLFLDGY
jgi:hypothetical protein